MVRGNGENYGKGMNLLFKKGTTKWRKKAKSKVA